MEIKAMEKEINNKGVTLIELIVAITIMVTLTGIVTPQMVKYIEKAKQVKIEQEASEFMRAAQLAFIEVAARGQAPGSDCIKNKTKNTSPYYKGGTVYGNLTNWTVHNGVVEGASNGPFADALFSLLGISYGTNWRVGKSSIPISPNQPKLNPAGSLTKECIFQIFYDQTGSMVIEYSREGYFVRMENSLLIDSVKIKNSTDKQFTMWQ